MLLYCSVKYNVKIRNYVIIDYTSIYYYVLFYSQPLKIVLYIEQYIK